MYLKLLFFSLFLILSVFPSYAGQSQGIVELFVCGGIIGILAPLALGAISKIWSFLMSLATSESNQATNLPNKTFNVQSQNSLSPWERYKSTHNEIAGFIEYLTDENLNLLSVNELNERLSVFRQMTVRFDCSIHNLKATCVSHITTQFSEDEMPEVIESLRQKAYIESRQHNIAIECTMPYYLHKWLKEYMA